MYGPHSLERYSRTFPEEREALKALLSVGFVDVFRALYPKKVQFTWWDYRQGRIWKNKVCVSTMCFLVKHLCLN